MRVLILHNDVEQRQLIQSNLNGNEFDVHELDAGSQALPLLESDPVDILILDFDLPDMPADELVSALLAAPLEKTPFLLLLVGEEHHQQAVDCLAPLLGDYITKPLDTEDLRARMKIAVRSIEMQSRVESVRGDTESLALYDRSTGIFNRHAVYEQAQAEVSRAQREAIPLTLAIIEVKNLGEINLQHGDKVGDQVLRYVSRATRANIRIYDLLGRWIGAKFLLVLPNANIRNAMKVLERVNQSIATIGIHLPQEDHINIEVGIGVTTSPVGDSLPLYILIEQANEALQKTDHPAPENLVVFS